MSARGFCELGVDLDAVLHIIQDKLNNPSPDDPFEPEIAGVGVFEKLVVVVKLIVVCNRS